MPRPPRPHRWALIAGAVLWSVLAGSGMIVLWRYSLTPGLPASPPLAWPAETTLEPPGGHPTLLVFAHPHCPCSRATIGELARLMTQAQGRVTAQVLFLRPSGVGEDWARSDLWRDAERIPGVAVRSDDGGVEAERFGAATSGQAMLFDGDGRLRFSGGITSARGHSGDNDGRTALTEILLDDAPDQPGTPVFGCPLFDLGNDLSHGGDSCKTT
jgi:hypothetical protein